MIDFSVPLGGMQRAEDRVNSAAQRIASAPFQPPGDSADLSTEAVGLLDARNAFAANVKVAHVADEMARSTLDILA